MNCHPLNQNTFASPKNTQRKVHRCWPCTRDKKRCTIEKNSPSPSPCQRCRDRHREDQCYYSTQEPTRRRMKCMNCRNAKQACKFEDGPYPNKCQQCKHNGWVCSAPTKTERQMEIERSKNDDSRSKMMSTPLSSRGGRIARAISIVQWKPPIIVSPNGHEIRTQKVVVAAFREEEGAEDVDGLMSLISPQHQHILLPSPAELLAAYTKDPFDYDELPPTPDFDDPEWNWD
ncbi:hypothetical protein BDD12DRAFT_865230 [Trichophaea hybrida]|nr:hypothetical protein BDD12DRAFT_865230 [Trichophaea hybrida]